MILRDTRSLLDHVRSEPVVRDGAHGCIGYCMSGQFVVSAAGTFPDEIAAAASLYGVRIVTDEPDSPHLLSPRIQGELYLGFASDDPYVPEGVITGVLGEAGRPDVETQAVIAAHGLRTEFDQQVLAMARRIARDYEAQAAAGWPEREDLTDTFVFTIDPPDAKDFDDAISIEHDRDADRWTLGVHIADVAHFVRQGGPLDEEANWRHLLDDLRAPAQPTPERQPRDHRQDRVDPARRRRRTPCATPGPASSRRSDRGSRRRPRSGRDDTTRPRPDPPPVCPRRGREPL